MRINFESLTPVYMQIAQGIEDDIISGVLKEGDAAYSQLIIARELSVNPATAAKGINVLVAKGILERQRGTAMTVTRGAVEKLKSERRERDFRQLVSGLVAEAAKLGIAENEVITEVKKQYEKI